MKEKIKIRSSFSAPSKEQRSKTVTHKIVKLVHTQMKKTG